MLGGIGYALFGASRQMAVGPTSAISLMIAASVGALAAGGAVRYGENRSSAGPRCGGALPDRLALPTQHPGPPDQRQHFGRLQGRRRAHHHHDPTAEPVW